MEAPSEMVVLTNKQSGFVYAVVASPFPGSGIVAQTIARVLVEWLVAPEDIKSTIVHNGSAQGRDVFVRY